MLPWNTRLKIVQPRRQPANLRPFRYGSRLPMRCWLPSCTRPSRNGALLCIPHFIVICNAVPTDYAYRWIWADVSSLAVTKWVRGLQLQGSKNNYKLKWLRAFFYQLKCIPSFVWRVVLQIAVDVDHATFPHVCVEGKRLFSLWVVHMLTAINHG